MSPTGLARRVPAGQRVHVVTLQTPGLPVPDGDGGVIQGWDDLDPATVKASITPASARDLEKIASGTVITQATHVITIPYHAAGHDADARRVSRAHVFPDERDQPGRTQRATQMHRRRGRRLMAGSTFTIEGLTELSDQLAALPAALQERARFLTMFYANARDEPDPRVVSRRARATARKVCGTN